jgi:hypothetical protein
LASTTEVSKVNYFDIFNNSDFRVQESNSEGDSTGCPSDCPEEKLFESFFEDIKHLVVNFEENRGTENAETYLKILLNRVHVSSFHSNKYFSSKLIMTIGKDK